MIISANGGGKEFKPCPEYSGRAVCVDVSPLKEYETEYGVKKKFKFAFELDLIDDSQDPVQPWVVLSKPLVPSLHEKAALTKLLKDWFGRKLTDAENRSLDLESLIGKPVNLIIAHEQSQDGSRTYANIKLMMPHKHGEALQPSGLWFSPPAWGWSAGLFGTKETCERGDVFLGHDESKAQVFALGIQGIANL